MSDDARYQITPDALAALEAELEALETTERTAMAERIRIAREWGDLKENAEYHDAKDAQGHLEARILRLQDRRRNAVMVEPEAGSVAVGLGSVVTVRDEATGRETTYTLVTAQEAEPAAGRLGLDAPLAQALAGAGVDDVVDFAAPRGTRRLRVSSLA